MKIVIKNRFTNEIMLEGEADSIKQFLEKNHGANLYRANLYGANLYRANLSEANLSEANLSGADLSGAKIKITQKEEFIKSLHIDIQE